MVKRIVSITAVVALGMGVPAQANVNQTVYVTQEINTGHGTVNCAASGGCVIYDLGNGYSEIDTGNGQSYLVDQSTGEIYGAP